MKYAAFLRGVNVSGHNPIKMEPLKQALLKSGYSDVTTYLQSGNVVFRTAQQKNESLESQLEEFLLREFKLHVGVLVKSQKEIVSLLKSNPFLDKAHDEQFLHITFLKGDPSSVDVDTVKKVLSKDEQFDIKKSCVYLYCPNGYGRTKLNNSNWEKWSHGLCTTRNWNTLMAMDSLLKE